jgi:hypothetical protein
MTRVCVCGEQIRRFVKEKPDGSLEYTAADVLNYLLGRFKEEYTVRSRGAGDRARWKLDSSKDRQARAKGSIGQADKTATFIAYTESRGLMEFGLLSSVESVEPEADERRFHKERILLTISNRKTRFWVVARLPLHCSMEMRGSVGLTAG